MYPKPVKLDKEDATELMKISATMMAIQSFIQQVVSEGEQRTANNQLKARDIWKSISKKYDIDCENIIWILDNDGEYILPVQIKNPAMLKEGV